MPANAAIMIITTVVGGNTSLIRPTNTPLKPERIRAGTITKPACNGDKPITCCKKIGTINRAPNSPILLRNAVAQIRLNDGTRNMRKLTTGCAAKNSRTTNNRPPIKAPNPSNTRVDISVVLLRPKLMASRSGTKKIPRAISPR